MVEMIPWDCPTSGNDGSSGSLRDVVRRWLRFETIDEQSSLIVSTSVPVQLAGWPEAKRGLGRNELSEIAERLSPAAMLPWRQFATLEMPAGLGPDRTTVSGQTLLEAVDLAMEAGNPAAGGFRIRMDDASHEWRDREIVQLSKQRHEA